MEVFLELRVFHTHADCMHMCVQIIALPGARDMSCVKLLEEVVNDV